MNTPQNKAQEESTTTSTEKVSERRRRMLQASAAAPLVATFQPAAAAALASAFQCIDDGLGVSNWKRCENGNSCNGDNAMREIVPYYRKIKKNGAEGKRIFETSPGNYFDQGGKVFTGALSERKGYANVLVLYEPIEGDTYITHIRQLGLWPEIQKDPQTAIPLNGTCLNSFATAGRIVL